VWRRPAGVETAHSHSFYYHTWTIENNISSFWKDARRTVLHHSRNRRGIFSFKVICHRAPGGAEQQLESHRLRQAYPRILMLRKRLMQETRGASPVQAISRAVLRIPSEDSISGNPAASRHAGVAQMWNEMYRCGTEARISPGDGTMRVPHIL